MIQGYKHGLTAAEGLKQKPKRYTTNPYPEWCPEYKRFQAGLYSEPDPNETGDTTPATIMSHR